MIFMTDEKLLARIFEIENLGKYDEDGDTGNIFIGFTPETLQNDIDYSFRKSGGSRVIKKLTGARQIYITIYARGSDYDLISEKLENICSTLLNKEYKIDDYFIENVFVFSEPTWVLKDDDNIHLFNMTLTLTII